MLEGLPPPSRRGQATPSARRPAVKAARQSIPPPRATRRRFRLADHPADDPGVRTPTTWSPLWAGQAAPSSAAVAGALWQTRRPPPPGPDAGVGPCRVRFSGPGPLVLTGRGVRPAEGGGVRAATWATRVDADLDRYTIEGILRECGGLSTPLTPRGGRRHLRSFWMDCPTTWSRKPRRWWRCWRSTATSFGCRSPSLSARDSSRRGG